MVISSVLNSSSSFDSQESDLVMEAVEATQFNDLNENLGIPIPDSGNKNAQRSQRRKKRAQKRVRYDSVQSSFEDFYELTGEILGEGAYAKVQGCIHKETGQEYAVKTVIKHAGLSRARVFKEIEIFYHCQGHKNIIQLIEFFEEEDRFFLIFEKINGGPLLDHIQKRVHFTENEASLIIRDLASALKYIHSKQIAHRDLKPENILCTSDSQVCPVKICDFDLGSKVVQNESSPISTPTLLSPVGSPLYLAPEIAGNFLGDANVYSKRCDLWSLGVIMYILLSGNPPFFITECGNDCGWERGEFCGVCQDLLFNSIQEGIYDFPENEWGHISDDAKDLIKHLLVKDASQRYTADMVLKHRWVAQGGPVTPLETPSIMRKNNSYKDLAAYVGGSNAIKRLVLQQQNLSSDFKSSFEQYVGSYKNSSSLAITDDSSPTFELHFTSDEDGDSPLNELEQQRKVVKCPVVEKIKIEDQLITTNNSTATTTTTSSKKPDIKSVRWIDLQEEEEDDYENNENAANNTNIDKKIITPMKSALKTSVDSSNKKQEQSKPIRTIKNKNKKKKTIKSRNGSTSSNTSSDELSDYNNNQYAKLDEGEDADIDEMDNFLVTNHNIKQQSTVAVQQTNRNKIQKMLECIENRKRLSSASCYVISNANKNNQTASLNFMKSMLII